MCSEHNDFKLKCFYPNLLVPIIKKSLFLHFSLYKWKKKMFFLQMLCTLIRNKSYTLSSIEYLPMQYSLIFSPLYC